MSQPEMGQAGEWRVAVKGEQRGPFTLDQLRAMLADGRLPPDTLVWKPGMANWTPMSGVPELGVAGSRGPVPAAPVAPMPGAASPATGRRRLMDFLTFRDMLTPVLIQLLFWIGVASCAITGLVQLVDAFRFGSVRLFFMAVASLVVVPVFLRVWCELMILLFKIHETLQEIKDQRK
jgi:hypothetical protein